MNRTPLRLVLLLGLLCLLGAGTAGAPISLSDWNQRIRPGVTLWASRLILDANSNTFAFPRTSGTVGSASLCIPDRATVMVVAGNEMTCALALTSTITLGSQTTAGAVVLTDANGPDGPGNVHTLPQAGNEWFETVDVTTLRQMVGARTGLCTTPAWSFLNGPNVRVPCRVDGDCTDADAGSTCDTAPSESSWANACAFAVCRAVNAATDATLTIEY